MIGENNRARSARRDNASLTLGVEKKKSGAGNHNPEWSVRNVGGTSGVSIPESRSSLPFSHQVVAKRWKGRPDKACEKSPPQAYWTVR